MRREEERGRRRGDWDAATRRFFAATDRRDAERRLDWLYSEFLGDTVTRVLTEELRRGVPATRAELDEETDAFNDLSLLVRVKVAQRLLGLWEGRPPTGRSARSVQDGIGNLHAYVVAICRNACVDYLRRRHPGRHALDNALRAAFTVRPQLALWQAQVEGDILEWRCGEPAWQAEGRPPVSLRFSPSLQARLRDELEGLERPEALLRVFHVTQAPLRFTELLTFLAEYWDVEAPHRAALREGVPFRVPKPYLMGIQPEEIVDLMGILHSLWGWLSGLSRPQVATLLLKVPLHEGGSYLDAMVRLNVASWGNIAQAVGIPTNRLLEIAPGVPLEDQEIADVLGLALEDVPRIRQDARRRLARQRERLREGEEK